MSKKKAKKPQTYHESIAAAKKLDSKENTATLKAFLAGKETPKRDD